MNRAMASHEGAGSLKTGDAVSIRQTPAQKRAAARRAIREHMRAALDDPRISGDPFARTVALMLLEMADDETPSEETP